MTRDRSLALAAAALTMCVALVTGPLARTPDLAVSDAPALPGRLADTGLYSAPGLVEAANRQFVPQYPLWSDGLAKKRWVYLPAGKTIDATADWQWRFPVGTKFWKEFTLDGRKIETRMIWKTASEWLFGSYVWNEDGTEALLASSDGVRGIADVAPGRRHSIPSRTECIACHGSGREAPLGFNALQLSTDRDPNAIHGERIGPDVLTLRQLVAQGLLSPARPDLLANPPRVQSTSPATRSMIGYLAANCGMCHNGNGEIAALGPVIRYQDITRDADAVARRLIGQRTAWQIPGTAGEDSVLVHAGAPELSAMLVRMRSRSPSSQMPPLGTVVRDQQAVDAITRWIESRTGQ